MNIPQLQRMAEQLTKTAATSGFQIWGSANEELLAEINKVCRGD